VDQAAGHGAADEHFFDHSRFELVGYIFVNHLVAAHDDFARLRVVGIARGHAPNHALAQALPGDIDLRQRNPARILVVRVGRVRNPDARFRFAIVAIDDHVLCHVDQAPRHVPGVRRTERCVSQALAGAVRRDEILERRQAHAEVTLNRQVDDSARWIGHQTAHSRQLGDRAKAAFGRAG